MTAAAEPAADVTPLVMARDWARRVHEIAEHYAERDRLDPGMGRVEAHVAGAGKAQFEAAQMASFMATVSIAEDVRRIADVLCRADDALDALDRADPA